MKNLFKMKKVLLGVLVLGFAMSSCTDGWEELNTDPNDPTAVPQMNIFANAQIRSSNRSIGGWTNHTNAALWCQMFAKIQYISEDYYKYRPGVQNNAWNGAYAGELKDFQIIIDISVEKEHKNIEALGRIMKAHTYLMMTDKWGDIPYSQALRGDDIENGTLTPVYDTQEAIYADLIKELEESVVLLKANMDELHPGEAVQNMAGDLFYGGDFDQWIKFANSLQLRILMRASGRSVAGWQAKFETIVADGDIFADNDDDAQLDYLMDENHWNPLFANQKSRSDHAVSKTMVDILLANNDPRLPFYAQDIDSDARYGKDGPLTTYAGQPNGASTAPDATTISLLGVPYAYTETAPLYFQTYAEVQFILAEAAAKGWSVGGTAQSFYEEGVTASVLKWGGTAAQATALLAETGMVYADATKFEQIGTQKWVALFPQGLEGFAELRRTGFPSNVIEPAMTPYPGQGIIVRFPYPDDELSYNGVNAEAARTGITDNGLFGVHVWWDTRIRDSNGF